ncbi:MAG: hypothetical protein A2Y38_10920 [Spirochaetes bacterium GWB1_59_5]|nr:MAG: hypothetical protein A2Y38_10920 [Spirochaetes bacterium GWB1_59_5]
MTIEEDIEVLLDGQRGMSLVPSCDKGFLLAGDYCFHAKPEGGELVSDQFAIGILVPDTFPSQLPTVWEVGSRIPRKSNWHINIKTDCSICLGGELSLRLVAREYPSLTGYLENTLVPYLYAVCLRERHGGPFIFSELSHGGEGLIEEVRDLLVLPSDRAAVAVIRLLSMKKRGANKMPCPCGCGERFGICQLHGKLYNFRSLETRKFYKAYLQHMRK